MRKVFAVLMLCGIASYARVVIPYSVKPPSGTIIETGIAVTRGLIGVWTFNENAGPTTRDATGIYGDGTLSGSTGVPAWGVAQTTNGAALSFVAANNQYVNIPDQAGHRLTDYTIETMFYMNSIRNYNGIVSKTNTGVAAPFDVWVGADATCYFWVNNTQHATSGVGEMVANAWYHAVFEYKANGTRADMYLNNIARFGLVSAANADAAFPIRIGDRQDGVTQLDGKIAYVRLWNRYLAESEVHQLYINHWTPMYGGSASARNRWMFVASPVPQFARATVE